VDSMCAPVAGNVNEVSKLLTSAQLCPVRLTKLGSNTHIHVLELQPILYPDPVMPAYDSSTAAHGRRAVQERITVARSG
jgi:hypothetical protein